MSESGKKSELVSLSLSNLEVQWLRKSVATQRGVLARSRAKEIPGSEIFVLRTKELESLDHLLLALG